MMMNKNYNELLDHFGSYEEYQDKFIALDRNKNNYKTKNKNKKFLIIKISIFIGIALLLSYYFNIFEKVISFIGSFIFMSIFHHIIDDILDIQEIFYNLIRITLLLIFIVIVSVIYYTLTGEGINLETIYYGLFLGGTVSMVILEKGRIFSI